MTLFWYLKESFGNLFTFKLRSGLALLGMLVGTASIVAMVLGGEMASHETLKQFTTLGTDLLAVSISTDEDTVNNLSSKKINEMVNPQSQIKIVAPYIQMNNILTYHGDEMELAVIGATESFKTITQFKLLAGRFVSNLDKYNFFCVVGHKIFGQMNAASPEELLGKQVRINKSIFTIIGVAAPWAENSFVAANLNNAVIVPIGTLPILNKYAQINNILMALKPDANIDDTKQYVQSFLQAYAGNDPLFFRSAKELIARMVRQSEILTIFLGFIGSVSLLVSGIGIMNIMLVSILERKREIGIRLAIGATATDIRLLFLTEAIILSILGGSLGVITGIFIAYGVAFFCHWQFQVFLLPVLLGFSVSLITGLFFGFYPAHKASMMHPIDALRTD